MAAIAHDDTVLAESSSELPTSCIRVIVRGKQRAPTPAALLDRRFRIARALVLAHRRGATPERLRRLDAAYVATRVPLAEGESYDE